jgi:hypothetical protein
MKLYAYIGEFPLLEYIDGFGVLENPSARSIVFGWYYAHFWEGRKPSFVTLRRALLSQIGHVKAWSLVADL